MFSNTALLVLPIVQNVVVPWRGRDVGSGEWWRGVDTEDWKFVRSLLAAAVGIRDRYSSPVIIDSFSAFAPSLRWLWAKG